MSKVRACGLAAVLAFTVLGTPCLPHAAELYVQSRPAMGTVFTIYLYANRSDEASAHFDSAFDEIERLEEALSNYRDSSELSRINRLAAHEAVVTDPEVFGLLQQALAYSRRSDGVFDITVGPLMRAWGFFRGHGHYPSAAELAEARSHTGWTKVELDAVARSVRFTTPGVELDLGGIGKGYAVDRVIELLRDEGVTSALVDAGSSTLNALGAPPGKSGWTVHVPQPGDRSQTVSTVLLRDESLSTSGSYEKFFRLNGRMYCHIMDPRTGKPVEGILQTTVIAGNGTTTDALSTTMFVMGPEKGKALLEHMPGARGIWIIGKPEAQRVITWRWRGMDCGNRGECVSESTAAKKSPFGRPEGRVP